MKGREYPQLEPDHRSIHIALRSLFFSYCTDQYCRPAPIYVHHYPYLILSAMIPHRRSSLTALADRFIKGPHEVVKPGQVVKVKVINVDLKRQCIALTMRLDDAASPFDCLDTADQ